MPNTRLTAHRRVCALGLLRALRGPHVELERIQLDDIAGLLAERGAHLLEHRLAIDRLRGRSLELRLDLVERRTRRSDIRFLVRLCDLRSMLDTEEIRAVRKDSLFAGEALETGDLMLHPE